MMTIGHQRTRGAVGVVPAVIVYLGLELFGVSALVAFAASLAVVAAGLGWLAWRGGLTRMALASSALFAGVAAAVSVTGNLWLFLIKPVATGVILGAVILVNVKRGAQPYSLSVLCRLRPRRREELLRRYEDDPIIRHRHYTVTRVWGVAVIADGLVRAAALLILPPWLAVATSMPLTVVAVTVGTSVSLRYLSTSPRPSAAIGPV